MNLNNFRTRDWYPALECAGFDQRGPHALRHTYATFLLDHVMSISPGSDDTSGRGPPAAEAVRQGQPGQRSDLIVLLTYEVNTIRYAGFLGCGRVQ